MRDQPIISSLLDVDFYKLSMGQMIYHLHPNVPVTFSFINRSKSVSLPRFIDIGRLREELEHCRSLRFTSQELHYVMGTYEYDQPMFSVDFIKFLNTLALPEFQLEEYDGQFVLNFAGAWSTGTYWETIGMSVMNELFFRSMMTSYSRFEREQAEANGRLRLGDKVRKLRDNSDITFSDFGTRRRFSRSWQDYVVGTLSEELPGQFKGTSNVLLAQKYGVMPTGTNAHELPMVYSGIYREEDDVDPASSQRRVLTDWETEYSLGLSLFLPDTFGSNWFFENVVTEDQLRRWKGSRQDSGDPLDYAERRIQEYRNFDIDPLTKLIVFADGLSVKSMKYLASALKGRVRYTFGWGTDLTNDLGFKPISIVIKPTMAAGHPVAKLSDNIAKATGPEEAVARMKNLVGYTNTFLAECVS